jgi:hypothetical protein
MLALLLVACNPDPGEAAQGIAYRDGSDGGTTSGERGTVKITEVLWSGSVASDGTHDPDDQFIELRNEGSRPANITGWQLRIDAGAEVTLIIPELPAIPVGEHILLAAKDTGCFPQPDGLLEGLSLQYGEPFRITLLDADEHLIEPIGGTGAPPLAGGYDLVRSRSMERVELMFGGSGMEPGSWHYYTPAEVDVPNNDRIAADCQALTLASPGRPNSPDYSGAYSTGSFE